MPDDLDLMNPNQPDPARLGDRRSNVQPLAGGFAAASPLAILEDLELLRFWAGATEGVAKACIRAGDRAKTPAARAAMANAAAHFEAAAEIVAAELIG